MASNRQKVLALANTIGGRIKDKKFFLSKQVAKFFNDKVMALTKRYNSKVRVPVKILWDEPDITAWTDHRVITINANCGLLDGMDRPIRFLTLQGFLFHEVGHILYTDQNYKIKAIKEMAASKKLYPEPNLDATELNDFLATSNHMGAFLEIWRQIWNSLEDGYIEYRFLEEHEAPIFADGLLALRNVFVKTFTSVSDMKKNEKEEPEKLFTILNLLLCYAKFGKLCYNNKREEMDERIQAVISCIPYVDDVNNLYETEEHYKAVNDVIVMLTPYLIEFLKTLPEEENEENSTGGNDSSAGEGGSSEVPSAPQAVVEVLSEIAKNGGLSDSGNEDEEESEDSSPLAEAPSNAASTSTPSGEKPRNGVEEGGSPSEIPEPSEESVARSLETAKKLLDEMAQEEAEKELTKEHEKILNEQNRSIDYGEIHSSVSCDIIRDSEVIEGAKEAWEEIAPQVNKIAKATTKTLRQILKDRRNGSVMRGLYFGKQICPVSYSRYDKKYFQNKKLPTDSPTLSICVLIDESGSMDGDKIEYAKLMALVVYRFCEELGIRLKVVGHCSNSGYVKLTTYTEYDGGFDKNDIYRLMQIRAKSSNRDGYALRYCTESLKKEFSDIKLCIVISDGAPADSGYYGQNAYEDIKNVVKTAKCHGIDVIAAAIDDDKEDIKEIYGEDRFLDITNLEDLPKTITNCIKKYLPKC